MSSQDLLSYLEGTLRNCEHVLFSNFDEPGVAQKDIELRPELSARQIAKLYGFTQKLLTKHIDQLGVGAEDNVYREEVKSVRKAFVHRCNLILDKLEEKNQQKVDGIPGMSMPVQGSVHNITIVQGVVYSSIFLCAQQVTLYVPPMLASEHSHLLDASDTSSCLCHCDESPPPSLRRLALLEHVITTTQQRLLDDGLLEYPSRTYNVTSYEMVSAKIFMHRQVAVAIPQLPLFAATIASDPSPPPVCVSLYHPHEATAASMLPEGRVLVSGECNALCLLLSEEGTNCHVSLVAFHPQTTAGGETDPLPTTHSVVFQDKFRVKVESKTAKAARGVKSKPPAGAEGGGFFLAAPLFAERLRTEITRALCLEIEEEASHGKYTWQDISSVHFIVNDKSLLREWLETALLDAISEQPSDSANVKTIGTYTRPYFTDASHLYCEAVDSSSRALIPLPSLLLGSAVGIRVDNFTPTITTTKDPSPSDETAESKTSICESNEFIPFLEPFQQVPVRVQRRIRGSQILSRIPAGSNGTAAIDVVVDVVEENRCSCGGRESSSTSSGVKGYMVNSLLCGVLTVMAPVKEQNESKIAEIDLVVEICIDANRDVFLRVLNPDCADTGLSLSTLPLSSLEPVKVAIDTTGGNPSSLRGMRKIFAVEERCVRESDLATRWSCADLAADYKLRGNVYMKRMDYAGAIVMYSVGLACAEAGEASGVLASNRCAAYTHLNCFSAALDDAKECVRQLPDWEKGWARLGSVLFRLKRLEESLQAYEKAISLAPTNSTILDAHQEVRDVVMVRQAEEAAVEAKRHASNMKKSGDDVAPNRSSSADNKKECNDICVIC